MTKREEPLPSLAQLEAEAVAYGQRIAREYLQDKLQRLAQTQGEVFPPKPKTPVAPAPTGVATQDRAGGSGA